MPDNPASPNSAQTADNPAQAAGAGEDLAAIKAELESLKSQVAEQKQAAEYWFGKANGKGEQSQPKKEDTPGGEDDVDVLDIITTKGMKGLDELMAKRGYVRAKEVDEKVNIKAQQVAKEAELLARYPDLKKQDSDFFKTTAGHYGAFKKAGIPEHMAMELAAEKAELELIRAGKLKTARERSDEEKAQREQERRARIAAQAGERNHRPTEGDEEDEELTPEQKRIAAAMGITEDAYKARAKKGVAIRGGLK